MHGSEAIVEPRRRREDSLEGIETKCSGPLAPHYRRRREDSLEGIETPPVVPRHG